MPRFLIHTYFITKNTTKLLELPKFKFSKNVVGFSSRSKRLCLSCFYGVCTTRRVACTNFVAQGVYHLPIDGKGGIALLPCLRMDSTSGTYRGRP